MQQVIAAGILYLLGVAVVLVIKPSVMFAEDGSWKEFGIGRNQKTHTWFPFWFFAIVWALTSYIIVTIVFNVYTPQKQLNTPRNNAKPMNNAEEVELDDMEFEVPTPKKRGKSVKLPEGYYLMNTDGTDIAGGIPKYVYLGKGLPT